MNYYQHHIGDFNNATRYLTLVERALYRDLIEMYYDTEKAIDASNFDRLARRLMCSTNDEKTALKFVLSEFFDLVDNTYVQSRCEREIADYHAKKEQQSKAGKASAEKRSNKNHSSVGSESKRKSKDDQQNLNNSLTSVEQPFNDPSTNHKPLTNNHKPITINQEPIINNLKNKKDWLDFEKLRVDFESAYPNLDFDVIKSSDWFDREKLAFEKYNADKDFDEAQMIYHFADRLANVFKTKYSGSEPKSQDKPQDKKSNLSEKQIHFFAQKLANHPEVSSKFAEVGETHEQFAARLAMKLTNPEQRKKFAPYLAQVGFEGAVV